MSSHDHLDASSGREVVFCHACHEEWYRDAHPTLQCPNCDSEVTEIIEPGNDPRADDSPSDFDSSFPGPGRDHSHEDSDPGEEDIEDHLPPGRDRIFVHHRVFPGTRSGPDRARPDDDMAVFQRFTDMLMNDFRVGTPDRPHGAFEDGPRDGPGTRIHRATFTTGPGGFRGGSVTIGFGPAIRRVGPPPDARGPPDFDGIFGSLMNNVPPPRDDGSQQGQGAARGGNAQGGQGLPPPFFATLQDLLATLLSPGAAVHGDAVYTQEALDRIITQLMEANPQSNAAPPASAEALANLEKKPLDEKMIGSDEKVECTICIDELSKGEDVTVLPCKHFFHPECVTMWLKEHNTCPICRTPIEQREANGSRSNDNHGNPDIASSPGLDTTSPSPPEGRQESRPWGAFAVPFRSEVLWDSQFGSSPSPQASRNTRSAQQNEDRLNTIRNLRDLGAASRRSSHSPPSRETGSASAIRVRSPSWSRDRDRDHGRDAERDQERASPQELPRDAVRQHWSQHWSTQRPSNQIRQNSGSNRPDHGPPDGPGSGGSGSSSHGNPLNWLRDRFSRDRGSGPSSENGRRRS